MNAERRLRRVKLLHTVAWAFFAACVVGIPLAALQGRFAIALTCIAFVTAESIVLIANRWRCPLTDVAAQYTDDRAPNFDIYLPRWLALYNKEIFGPLFVLGTLFALSRWLGWP